MIPARFDYHRPSSLDEALSLLSSHGEDAKILTGGQSLIPLLKLRLAQPAHLVDLNGLSGLDTLAEDGGVLRIGALVRESALEDSELVRTRYPALHDTARVVADPLVRSRATVCGNVAHGDPANDHPATMLALGAEAVLTGPSGQRTVPMTEFFTGLFATALEPDEVLTELRIPAPRPGTGGAYVKLERKVGDFATAAVAARVTLDDGVCAGAGIGLTNVGLTPIRAADAEALLEGEALDDGLISEAAELAAAASSPTADRRGSVEFKRDLVRVLTARALRRAAERAAAAS